MFRFCTAGLLRPGGPGQARGAESLISARGARRESRLRASARLGQPWLRIARIRPNAAARLDRPGPRNAQLRHPIWCAAAETCRTCAARIAAGSEPEPYWPAAEADGPGARWGDDRMGGVGVGGEEAAAATAAVAAYLEPLGDRMGW